jgi:hypothetical protein
MLITRAGAVHLLLNFDVAPVVDFRVFLIRHLAPVAAGERVKIYALVEWMWLLWLSIAAGQFLPVELSSEMSPLQVGRTQIDLRLMMVSEPL